MKKYLLKITMNLNSIVFYLLSIAIVQTLFSSRIVQLSPQSLISQNNNFNPPTEKDTQSAVISDLKRMPKVVGNNVQINNDFNSNDGVNVDIEKKLKTCVSLVNDAIRFFSNNSVSKSCYSFNYDKRWKHGEIYIFVMDQNGILLVNGNDISFIWKNVKEYKGEKEGQELINLMIENSAKGNWINYNWRNDWKHTYVKSIKKENKTYIIGAGFYPKSDSYTVVQLVKNAVQDYYNQGQEKTWQEISNPRGKFKRGNIYLYANDFNGVEVADGDNPALIGQNIIDTKDDNGNYVVKRIIKSVENPEGRGWSNYIWRRALKIGYNEKVTNPITKKSYIIGAGYYPKANSSKVKDLTNKAIHHIESVGLDQARINFSSYGLNNEFRYGPIGVFLYNLKGEALVDSENTGFVGQNLMNRVSPTGFAITKALIQKAQEHGQGWVSYIDSNAYKNSYVKLINLPEGQLIIGASYFPYNKQDTVKSLVEEGREYLSNNDKYLTFQKFSDIKSPFFRGDVYMFVYSPDGTLYVNGNNKTIIWNNYLKSKDDKGNTIVSNLISLAKAGGGWLTYDIDNAKRRVYVEYLRKRSNQNIQSKNSSKNNYIIGSGYFL